MAIAATLPIDLRPHWPQSRCQRSLSTSRDRSSPKSDRGWARESQICSQDGFPPLWNLFGLTSPRHFTIGESREAPRLSVERHRHVTKWSGHQPALTVYSGSQWQSDVLATIVKPAVNTMQASQDNMSSFYAVLPTSQTDAHQRPLSTVVEVHARSSSRSHDGSLPPVAYRYALRVGRGWSRWTQQFEWRRVRKAQMDVLRQRAASTENDVGRALQRISGAGWVLIRCGQGQEADELVAIWMEDGSAGEAGTDQGTNSPTGCFALVNSGATGELGQQFVDVAGVTALGIWNVDDQQC